MNILEFKCINKIKNNSKNNSNNKYLKHLLVRSLITIILFLSCSIAIKKSDKYKEFIYKNVYNENFTFTSIKNFYDKYLGGVLPINSALGNIQPVFKEELVYSNKSKFLDGYKLKVTDNYLVPVLKSGIVVFVGEKEEYGKTIIIQGMDGVDIWYSNIENISVDLYDYIEEKTLLANTINNDLYITISKDGNYLDYDEYFKTN